ncbi:hypothetical protein [Halobellus ordinarius]|uniref:hypothetical protein n=1 Tax=Halobellus ordinarius TaxID=3075120 RepID=UPI00288061AD|nr:hypothetical protein [Halobellus sp. ZY16]
MVLSRRTALHLAGTTAATALAGCASLTPGSSTNQKNEYRLSVNPVNQPLVEYVLYQPGESVYDQPAHRALSAILPDGRHTTYGYEPLPEDAYVAHSGRYYQTKTVVTGEQRMERPFVRVTPIPEDQVPENAPVVDSLARPVGRVIKILHSYAVTNGESGSADLLRDDAYVLRRPYELDSRLTGDLDGQIVTMDSDGHWAYRINVATERLYEPAYTTLALEVAATTDAFRDIAFAAKVDIRLDPAELGTSVQQLLNQAIARDTYRETTPLSTEYMNLIDALDLEHVETASNGHHLWYDDTLYRYSLYISDAN